MVARGVARADAVPVGATLSEAEADPVGDRVVGRAQRPRELLQQLRLSVDEEPLRGLAAVVVHAVAQVDRLPVTAPRRVDVHDRCFRVPDRRRWRWRGRRRRRRGRRRWRWRKSRRECALHVDAAVAVVGLPGAGRTEAVGIGPVGEAADLVCALRQHLLHLPDRGFRMLAHDQRRQRGDVRCSHRRAVEVAVAGRLEGEVGAVVIDRRRPGREDEHAGGREEDVRAAVVRKARRQVAVVGGGYSDRPRARGRIGGRRHARVAGGRDHHGVVGVDRELDGIALRERVAAAEAEVDHLCAVLRGPGNPVGHIGVEGDRAA